MSIEDPTKNIAKGSKFENESKAENISEKGEPVTLEDIRDDYKELQEAQEEFEKLGGKKQIQELQNAISQIEHSRGRLFAPLNTLKIDSDKYFETYIKQGIFKRRQVLPELKDKRDILRNAIIEVGWLKKIFSKEAKRELALKKEELKSLERDIGLAEKYLEKHEPELVKKEKEAEIVEQKMEEERQKILSSPKHQELVEEKNKLEEELKHLMQLHKDIENLEDYLEGR